MNGMRTYIYTFYFHFFIISRPGLQWGDLFLELDFLRGREKLQRLDSLQFFKTHKFNLVILFLLSIWAYFSYHNWISDSEFWPVTLSGHFDQWRQHPSLIYKGFFHLTLGWIYWFDLDSVQHLKVAKASYSFLGVGYFCLFYLMVKKHLSEFHSLLVLLVVLTSSLGFSQVGVIRSDFLASLLVMLYLYLKNDEWSWKKQGAFFLLISVLLLLTTPKSIYWVVAIWIYLFVSLSRQQKIGFTKISLVLGILGLGLVTFIDQTYLQSQIFNSFYLAWKHNHELQQSQIQMNDLVFLSPYLKNDWALVVLTLCMLIASFFSRSMSWADRTFAALISVALLWHEPRLPFFVGSYLFVLFLMLVPVLKDIERNQRVLLFSIVILLHFSRFDLRQYYFPNQIQFKTIGIISSFIETHSYSVIDGLGLFPRVKKLDLTYIGPFDPVANEIFFKKIQNTKPDFLVYSGRFLNIEPEVSKFLALHYKNVGNGYWLRNNLKDQPRFIDVLPGYYFNFRPDVFLGR
jgi:hypothetical protein